MTNKLTQFEEEKLKAYKECYENVSLKFVEVARESYQRGADETREMIRKDLLEIAGQGEYEDLRREVENYFLLSNKEI